MSLAWYSGWLATALMIAAALVPLVHRLARGKRADVKSQSVSSHIMLGLAAPVAVVFALAFAPIAFGLACAGAWVGIGGGQS